MGTIFERVDFWEHTFNSYPLRKKIRTNLVAFGDDFDTLHENILREVTDTIKRFARMMISAGVRNTKCFDMLVAMTWNILVDRKVGLLKVKVQKREHRSYPTFLWD